LASRIRGQIKLLKAQGKATAFKAYNQHFCQREIYNPSMEREPVCSQVKNINKQLKTPNIFSSKPKTKQKQKNTIKTNLQIYIYWCTGHLMVETRDNEFIFVESKIFLDNDYRINNGEEESEASTNTKYINRGKKIHESRSRLT
jgi:hypothetical protein